VVLVNQVCERRGGLERKKRCDSGKVFSLEKRRNFKERLKRGRSDEVVSGGEEVSGEEVSGEEETSGVVAGDGLIAADDRTSPTTGALDVVPATTDEPSPSSDKAIDTTVSTVDDVLTVSDDAKLKSRSGCSSGSIGGSTSAQSNKRPVSAITTPNDKDDGKGVEDPTAVHNRKRVKLESVTEPFPTDEAITTPNDKDDGKGVEDPTTVHNRKRVKLESVTEPSPTDETCSSICLNSSCLSSNLSKTPDGGVESVVEEGEHVSVETDVTDPKDGRGIAPIENVPVDMNIDSRSVSSNLKLVTL